MLAEPSRPTADALRAPVRKREGRSTGEIVAREMYWQARVQEEGCGVHNTDERSSARFFRLLPDPIKTGGVAPLPDRAGGTLVLCNVEIECGGAFRRYIGSVDH